MKVRVQVSHLAIDIVPGEIIIYKQGQEFECPDERVAKLGNSVIVLEDTLPPDEIQPPKRKRR